MTWNYGKQKHMTKLMNSGLDETYIGGVWFVEWTSLSHYIVFCLICGIECVDPLAHYSSQAKNYC